MKRAQVGISESIAVLFIFLLFMTVGFEFYGKVQKLSASQQIAEGADLLAIGVAERAAYLPELQCSSKNVVVDNCFDIMKVDALSGMDQDLVDTHYFDIFGYSNITVKKVYPAVPQREWVVYDKELTDENGDPIKTSSIFTSIPISLYDAKERQYYFGVLNVVYYSVIQNG